MSVLIKGMKMPNNCMECDIKAEDDDGPYCPFTKVMALNIGIQNDCPLVEVPEPHGRLMDIDYIIRKYIDSDIEKFNNSDVKIVLQNLKANLLSNAPTVIEVEDE